MSKYKNSILIIIAVLLLIYAAFISIIPSILTSSFNTSKFEEKFYQATSLLTTVDSVSYKIKPNLDTIITVKNLNLEYIDHQPLLDAKYVELTTSLSAIFGSTYKIKSLNARNITYSDQILPNGENKIAFLPGAFNSKIFGKKKITIIAGPVNIKNYNISYRTPETYKENKIREIDYSKSEVKDFLTSFYYTNVKIK